jgi:simple sugar transport system substrate-binding protein
MTAPLSTLSKRPLLRLVGGATLAASLAALGLTGCSKKEEAAPAPAAPASAAAPKPEPLKVAFAYVGPVGDGGWTFAHDNARKALEKEFGDKIVTSYVEKVPEAADAERVFNDLVGQMIGELGTSHTYVSGGDLSYTPPNPIPTGAIGATPRTIGVVPPTI